jgi:vacuolar-type H+-ATPase subunit F/Vma7
MKKYAEQSAYFLIVGNEVNKMVQFTEEEIKGMIFNLEKKEEIAIYVTTEFLKTKLRGQ